MKQLLMVLLFLCPVLCFADGGEDLQEGDIVFQTSKSSQSKYVMLATGSVWTHCGIVVKKKEQFYVLEASNVVKLTPINTWMDRGRFGICKFRRVFNHPVKIKYKRYLGKPYDLQFRMDNGKLYCSELVWIIYKRQFNIELCKPKPVKEYHTFGLGKLLKKRGISLNQKVVAPCDLLK